jgi:tRNA1Val (adenine37-N6)-methyltransferase
MANPYFQFKVFTVYHDRCAMKVTTDACLFGAWIAKHVGKAKPDLKALDIGTGTGLLSLMIVQKHGFSVDAIEIEPEASEQARENIAASPYARQIRVQHSDIVQWKQSHYDIIFSNPPFYENELKSPVSNKNIAHHNDSLTLEVLLKVIQEKLKEGGNFYLLLPYKREKESMALMASFQLFVHRKVLVYPSAQHMPIRIMLKGGKQSLPMIEESILIRESDSNYTEAFTELLRDYYLYL